MALMKQLALGSDVRAPIISVVMVSTVVTPEETKIAGELWLFSSEHFSATVHAGSFFILVELHLLKPNK